MKIALLPPTYWDQVEPMIKMATNLQQSHPLWLIKYQIMKGDGMILGITDDQDNILAAAILEIRVIDTTKQLVMTALGGGNMDDWLDDLSTAMDSIAKKWECSQIVCIGRLGWSKLLKPLGYKLETVEMVKEIQNG